MALLLLLVGTTTMATAGASADLEPAPQGSATPAPEEEGGFWRDNLLFRKEWMSEVGVSSAGWASRQSAGFELQKKISGSNRTYSGINVQNRLVRRDGQARPWGWVYEVHNFYADLYDLPHFFLNDAEDRAIWLGRLHLRIGKSYLPFGINIQTDTHGTPLQLSNERDFGFERDWGAGFWGLLTEEMRYDVGYFLGSGRAISMTKGQSGIFAGRIGLANSFSSNDGLEGGGSVLVGERRIGMTEEGSAAGSDAVVWTERAGLDFRVRQAIPTGELAGTGELAAGQDELDDILMQLYQLDYLSASRRYGLAGQYRWYAHDATTKWEKIEALVVLEASWYLKNEPAGANLHWLKLSWEHPFRRWKGDERGNVWSLQYYLFF